MKVVIAGSRGFIGSHLSKYFEEKGDELILISRAPQGPHGHYWNPEKQQFDASILEKSDVVINLAGENILSRWSDKKKDQIRESRYLATQLLCKAIINMSEPPKTYIGASAVHYYGSHVEGIVTEESPTGQGFLSEVCSYWEKIPEMLAAQSIRTLSARFGIVLGKGGALSYIEKAFRTGMGGQLGDGKQIMSWIAMDDLCHAMDHLISHSELTGPVNFVAPESVSNQQFSEIMGEVLNRKGLLPIPKFALSLLFGEGSEIFLSSIQATPKKLLESGYVFQYPKLEQALRHYL